ncbi:hypothetical protein IM40_06335 [Candidatus Paracaedimonas acanthamoebae]|nr:hypothetical protein IM40_06335 [Candidatus Paracaedimonas acanthamoebae]
MDSWLLSGKISSPEMAVAYCFIMAGIFTIFFAFASRYKYRPINLKKQGIFIVQGVCMFSINYILAYYALNYVWDCCSYPFHAYNSKYFAGVLVF